MLAPCFLKKSLCWLLRLAPISFGFSLSVVFENFPTIKKPGNNWVHFQVLTLFASLETSSISFSPPSNSIKINLPLSHFLLSHIWKFWTLNFWATSFNQIKTNLIETKLSKAKHLQFPPWLQKLHQPKILKIWENNEIKIRTLKGF